MLQPNNAVKPEDTTLILLCCFLKWKNSFQVRLVSLFDVVAEVLANLVNKEDDVIEVALIGVRATLRVATDKIDMLYS